MSTRRPQADDQLPVPRILIGPLMRPYLIGDWIHHPDILPFYWPAGIERYHAGVMEPELYRFPERCIPIDLQPGQTPEGKAGPTLAALWSRLPADFKPELLIWWGFFFPIPADIADCPVPSLLIVSDWHSCLGAVREYLPAFDAVVADQALLNQLADSPLAERCAYWPSYAWDKDVLDGPDRPRDIDICFVGNLNPAQYHVRNALLAEVAARFPNQLYVGQRQYGQDYAALLRRSKIVINHALRGEMNLRAYETAACGALLFQEADNLEIEAFLPAGEASIAYKPDTLCDQLAYYLAHDAEQEAIARRGQSLITQHTFNTQFTDLLSRLPELLAKIQSGSGRQPNRYHDPEDLGPLLQARHLSRIYLPETLAGVVTVLETALQRINQPASPPSHHSGDDTAILEHAFAVCLAHAVGNLSVPEKDGTGLATEQALVRVVSLLQKLASSSQDNGVLPALNLAWVHWFRRDLPAAAHWLGRAMIRLGGEGFDTSALTPWADFVLPLGFCTFAQEYERLPERHTQAEIGEARRRLLLWNGLLLQGQISATRSAAEALPYFQAAADLMPELPDAWLSIGQMQLQLASGQPQTALQAARRSLETGLATGGIYPWVYLALIRISLNLGDLAAVRSRLEAAEALFHGPGLEGLRQELGQLRRQLEQSEGHEGFL